MTLVDVDWPTAWVRPPEPVPLDEIDLGAMEGFWDQPDSYRDGAFFTLRHERPIPFFAEAGRSRVSAWSGLLVRDDLR